jgi:4-amino-4-deoxy-L-arabinose transferase-like glycosyltransferase
VQNSVSTVVIMQALSRQKCVLLGFVLCGALVLRVAALRSMNHSLYRDFLFCDEQTYHDWARALARGKPFAVYDQSALPAYVMAFLYRHFGPVPSNVRALNVGLSVLTCGFVFGIGRQLAGSVTGLVSAAVAAIYKPFVFLSVTLLKESLGLFVLSATTYCFLMAFRPRPQAPLGAARARWFVFVLLSGVAAGLAVNVRQNAIAPLVLVSSILLWTNFRRCGWRPTAVAALVLLAGFAVSTAPFAIHAYRETRSFSVTPVGGFNLYLGNYPRSMAPYYRPVPFASSVPREQGVGFVIEATRRLGRNVSPSEASAFWTREVMETARLQPRAFARRIFQKALAVFNRHEEADNHDIQFLARFVTFFQAPLLSFGMIAPLGFASIVLLARADSRARVIGASLLLYALTMVAVFTNMRIRIPLMLLLIPYSCMGVLRALHRDTPPAWKGWFAATTMAFVVVGALPLPGTGDLTAHYNVHAGNLRSKGRDAEAKEYLRQSREMNGAYSDYATLGLAQMALDQGDGERSITLAESVQDESYAAATKYDLIGSALEQLGLQGPAAAAYERALAVDFGARATRRKLIQVYSSYDVGRAEEQFRLLKHVESFNPGR